MKTVKIFLILSLIAGFYSCKETPNEEVIEIEKAVDTTTEKEVYEAAQTTAVFKNDAVGKAYNQYIVLKTALVNSDQNKSALAADVLMTYFSKIPAPDNALKLVQNIKDSKTLEEQRKLFSDLTPEMEVVLANAIAQGVVYKQFCPMANKNTGAYWYSNSKEVYNPYFGDTMLHCGKVTEELTQ